MRIRQAAELIGSPVHALRHWDDLGVVSPNRTAAGHRDYDEEDMRRLRVLRACQRVGMSLGDIRLVLHRDAPGRAKAIEQHLERVRRERRQLEDAERFLTHVLECRHGLLTQCSHCSRYADR